MGSGRPRHRWEDNIKTDLKGEYEDVDWIHMGQDRAKWWTG